MILNLSILTCTDEATRGLSSPSLLFVVWWPAGMYESRALKGACRSLPFTTNLVTISPSWLQSFVQVKWRELSILSRLFISVLYRNRTFYKNNIPFVNFIIGFVVSSSVEVFWFYLFALTHARKVEKTNRVSSIRYINFRTKKMMVIIIA